MDRADIIQLLDKLVRDQPRNADLLQLRQAVCECFAVAEPAPIKPRFDKVAYQRNYMRAYRNKQRANPFMS